MAQTNERFAGIRDLISDYKYSEAMERCNHFLEADSSNADLLILKGEVLMSMFRFNEAALALRQATSIDSNRIRGLRDLASLYKQTGETEEAILYYKKILERQPDDRQTMIQLAALLIQLGNYRDALNLLLPACKSDSGNFYILKLTATSYQELNNPDSALIYYLKARKINVDNPNIALSISNLLIRKKQYDSVIRYTERFAQENPKSYAVFRLGAYATYLKRNYPDAASKFRSSIRMGDASKFTQKYLGLCRYKLDMFDSACPSLRKAYQLDTTDAELCFYYGESLLRSNRPDSALLYLSRALRMILPSEQYLLTLYADLSLAFNSTDRADTALQVLIKAHAFAPCNPGILFKLAYQYDYYMHKPMTALPLYKQFLKQNKSSGETGDNPQVVMYSTFAVKRVNELEKFKKGARH
jgi:tetratricopeptide (TPR) repeat protein